MTQNIDSLENKNKDPSFTATLCTALPACGHNVLIRAMTVGQLQQLSQAAQLKQPQHLAKQLQTLLNACVQWEGGDKSHKPSWDTLLACDANALLLGLRRATFGNDWDFQAPCPACEKTDVYTVDLSQLPTYPGDSELIAQQLADPQTTATFVFPGCQKTAHFRLSMAQQLFAANTSTTQDGLLLQALLQHIVQVEGMEESGMPLRVFLRDHLSAGDATAFLQHLQEVQPALDGNLQLQCPHCAASFEHTVSWEGEHFFRPRQARKRFGKSNWPSHSTTPGT